MEENHKTPNIVQVIRQLQKDEAATRQPVPGSGLDLQLQQLRVWQSARLERTYRDLVEDARFASGCKFFLSDVYAAKDFHQRDEGFERLHDLLARLLPAESLQVLAGAIALNRMTNELDQDLLHALVVDLHWEGEITMALYVRAYRLCDNYSRRLQQIDLLAGLLRVLGQGAQARLVSPTLKVLRKPAYRLGWGDLHDFLTRGQEAFKHLQDVEAFAGIIERREKEFLARIYADDPDPYRKPI